MKGQMPKKNIKILHESDFFGLPETWLQNFVYTVKKIYPFSNVLEIIFQLLDIQYQHYLRKTE